MSIQGITTVAKLELMQRVRATRWKVVLGLWVFTIGGITLLTYLVLHPETGDANFGSTLYDLITFFVLALGMLVVPALTATSINGDRDSGVLATMQVTLLKSSDIVLGKLVAGLAVSLVLLLTASPFLLFAGISGKLHFWRAIVSILTLFFCLAVVCAVGLMFSAIISRQAASVVATYLTVAFLCIGNLILFFITLSLTQTKETVTEYIPTSVSERPAANKPPSKRTNKLNCVPNRFESFVSHPEKVWWLLAPNPFVVTADIAPQPAQKTNGEYGGFSPWREISHAVREARSGAQPQRIYCQDNRTENGYLQWREKAHQTPVWPIGFLTLGCLGAAATWVAIRRTRTPVGKLPRGTRIA